MVSETANKIRHMILLAVLALVTGAAGLFTLPVLDRDEARYVQATTQMLQSGDYVRIRLQDQARNKKPIGIYWLQAVSVQMFSDENKRQIWAYRLPSLMMAVLAILLTYKVGCRLFSPDPAFAGAALLAVSLLFGTEAGIAKTDATLLATTSLMMLALVQLRDKPDKRSALLFWAALGASVLIKGPVGPLLMVLVVSGLWVWERDANWMKPLLYWPGPILALAFFVPWVWLIQDATDGAFLQDALFGDFAAKLAGAQEEHGAPPGLNTLLLPIAIFPASFFLLPGVLKIWQLRQDKKQGAAARFLIIWVVPFFLSLEVIPTKLVHYPLPVYPAIALICGLGWQSLSEFPRARRFSAGLALLTPLLLVGLIFVLMQLSASLEWPAGWLVYLVSGFALVLALTTAIQVFRARANSALTLAVLAAIAWHISVRTLILPGHPMLHTSGRISDALQQSGLHPELSKGASSPVLSVNYNAPSLLFALNAKVVFTQDRWAADRTQQHNIHTIIYSIPECSAGARLMDAGHGLGAFIEEMQERDAVCPTVFAPPLSGYNYSTGTCLTIHMFTLAACPY